MKIWEPKPPGTLWATPGLLRDCFTFTFDEELLASEGRPFAMEWRQRRHVIVLRWSEFLQVPYFRPCGFLHSLSHCAWSRREARDAKSVSTASWYGFVARPLQSMLADEKSLLVDTNNKYCRFRHVTWPPVSLSPLLNTDTFKISAWSFAYRKNSKLAPDIRELSGSKLMGANSQYWDM